MSLIERVEQTILTKRLIEPGGCLVVAVSAGPDSTCLLRVLHELAPRFRWSLVVAHLNHGFRGAGARADAAFVERLAARLGWPVETRTIDMPAIMARQGGSAQDESRKQRYRFLQQVAARHQAQAIVLAHHQGDQAETVLQHLLRGAGTAGLCGMRMREEGAGDCPLVRPLLGESRLQLLTYLQSIGQSFRVDQSNAETHYQRNRLRWEVLPLLAGHNADLEGALGRTADLLQAEEQLLGQLAGDAYQAARSSLPPALALSVAKLRELPLALSRRVLRLAWQELSASSADLEYRHVEEALNLLTQPIGATCNWPRGCICRTDAERMLLIPPYAAEDGFWLPLTLPGQVTLPRGGGEIRATVLPRTALPAVFDRADTVYCDRDALDQPDLAVRSWLPGDLFQPFGMARKKKLQDFFVDNKVPRHQRQAVPLVQSGGELAWVAGLRLADPFQVTACSREIVRLEYRHPTD